MSFQAFFQEQNRLISESSNKNRRETIPSSVPPAPVSLTDLGLSSSFVSRLMVKHLYTFGVRRGLELAKSTAIPFPVLDGILNDVLDRQYAEKRGGQGLGNFNDRFGLTERGMNYARDLLEQDAYTGPAPVSLEHYWHYVQANDLKQIPVSKPLLRQAWQNFVVDETLFDAAGPAISSGKSCFLYGPPGTGKTFLAKKISEFMDRCGGPIAIPHAVLAGGTVIRVYDPVHHQKIPPFNDPPQDVIHHDHPDERWAVCRRPTVIAGGELTLDMLDLRYNPVTKYYEAPLQMKANGGVLIIDDFGRQLVRPKDLLNRWIVPLEERLDYLTLHTGKKFSIPFEQLVVFATNLNPTDLVDEAFLRRIRYKILVDEPSFEVFQAIFENECREKNLEVDMDYLPVIVEKYYRGQQRPLRACDARDITDQILDYCRFHDLPQAISNELFDRIAGGYLGGFSTGMKSGK